MENIRGLSINYDKNYHNIKKPSLNVIGNLIDTLKIKVIKLNLIYIIQFKIHLILIFFF